MEKYIIGVPVYDSDLEMFGTKIGLDDKHRTLKFTVWSKREKDSMELAGLLVDMLSDYMAVKKTTVVF